MLPAAPFPLDIRERKAKPRALVTVIVAVVGVFSSSRQNADIADVILANIHILRAFEFLVSRSWSGLKEYVRWEQGRGDLDPPS